MVQKSRKKSIFKMIIILLIPLTLTGCFNYRDINKVTFATSIIFDIDDLNQIVIFLDCIKPYRSTNEGSDKGKRIMFKGVGKTTEDALAQIEDLSSYALNYSQVRAYLFTENAAKKGVKKYLDLINNYNELQIKPSMFIYYGDVQELLKDTSSDEEYLGMYLNDLINKEAFNGRDLESNVNYYLSNRLMGNSTLLLPAIKMKKDVLDSKIALDGSAILKNNKLVDKLDSDDATIYDVMMGYVSKGLLEIGNPDTKEDFITLDIVSSTENSNLIYNDNKLTLVKNIDMNLEISDIQGEAIVNNELVNYVKVNEEEYVKRSVEALYNKYKERGIDIFNISRMKEIYYEKENIENPLGICDIQVNTNISINGTGISKNAL